MRPVEAVAWADAFEVDVQDLPWVLRHEVSRVDWVRNELTRLLRELRGIPDEEVRRGVYRSCSALSAAQARLMAVEADTRRSA
jgi:hypothetical protein